MFKKSHPFYKTSALFSPLSNYIKRTPQEMSFLEVFLLIYRYPNLSSTRFNITAA